MGERHTTGDATPAANDTGVVLGDLLRLLADASAHAWDGDRQRALHAVRRALAVIEAGLPPNTYTAELHRLRAQADPDTMAAFERRRGAA